jgi:hypothetical protein
VPTVPITSTAVEFWPPVVEPSTNGLMGVVDWIGEDLDLPDRFLLNGVRVRTYNYGAETSSGVWDAPWCDDTTGNAPTPGGYKVGTRPEFPPDYEPLTAWAYDSCDLTPVSQDEVILHAEQWLKLTAPIDLERWFATRLITDAGSLPTGVDFVTALGQIEAALELTSTQGFVHAGANLAAVAATNHCLKPAPAGSVWKWETPLGHAWVFGGGYSDILIDGANSVLAATSKPYGWRNAAQMLTTVEHRFNQYVAVAERSFCVGYESMVGAAVVTPS